MVRHRLSTPPDDPSHTGPSPPLVPEGDWKPGDPCSVCGSTDTEWGEPWQGGVCNGCGRSDSDE